MATWFCFFVSGFAANFPTFTSINRIIASCVLAPCLWVISGTYIKSVPIFVLFLFVSLFRFGICFMPPQTYFKIIYVSLHPQSLTPQFRFTGDKELTGWSGNTVKAVTQRNKAHGVPLVSQWAMFSQSTSHWRCSYNATEYKHFIRYFSVKPIYHFALYIIDSLKRNFTFNGFHAE